MSSMQERSAVETMEMFYKVRPEMPVAHHQLELLLENSEELMPILAKGVISGIVDMGTETLEVLQEQIAAVLPFLGAQINRVAPAVEEQLAAKLLRKNFEEVPEEEKVDRALSAPVIIDLDNIELRARYEAKAIAIASSEQTNYLLMQLIQKIQLYIAEQIHAVEKEIATYEHAQKSSVDKAQEHLKELQPVVEELKPEFDQKFGKLKAKRNLYQEAWAQVGGYVSQLRQGFHEVVGGVAVQSTDLSDLKVA